MDVGKKHPDQVIETASMSSVEPPDISYTLGLPDKTIDEAKLSALQLESIVYASQAHEKMLMDGNRAGFLIGQLLSSYYTISSPLSLGAIHMFVKK